MRLITAALLILSLVTNIHAAGRRNRVYYTASPASYSVQYEAISAVPDPVDALDTVNALRASRGLRPFIRDDGLTTAARGAAKYRAERRMQGHTNNDFVFLPAGSYANAAGCAGNESYYGFMSCCLYDSQYTYAGAAYVEHGGRLWCHLFVR